MPGTTTTYKMPYPVAADKVSAYPATGKGLADALEALLKKIPVIETAPTPLVGAAGAKLVQQIQNITTPDTSVSGGVYIPVTGWVGIAAVDVTPRNSDGRPLAVSVENVTTTQILVRFHDKDGPYYKAAGLPITLTITGWKN